VFTTCAPRNQEKSSHSQCERAGQNWTDRHCREQGHIAFHGGRGPQLSECNPSGLFSRLDGMPLALFKE
jgi:hypothetical protein